MLKAMSVRAIIVDDSPEFLQAARALLEREGMTVVAVAATAAEALRSAEEHDPDVVLLDIGLGDESGFEVAQLLNPPAGRKRPVILISARPEEEFGDLVEASPAIGFLPKPQLSATTITQLITRGDGPQG